MFGRSIIPSWCECSKAIELWPSKSEGSDSDVSRSEAIKKWPEGSRPFDSAETTGKSRKTIEDEVKGALDEGEFKMDPNSQFLSSSFIQLKEYQEKPETIKRIKAGERLCLFASAAVEFGDNSLWLAPTVQVVAWIAWTRAEVPPSAKPVALDERRERSREGRRWCASEVWQTPTRFLRVSDYIKDTDGNKKLKEGEEPTKNLFDSKIAKAVSYTHLTLPTKA